MRQHVAASLLLQLAFVATFPALGRVAGTLTTGDTSLRFEETAAGPLLARFITREALKGLTPREIYSGTPS